MEWLSVNGLRMRLSELVARGIQISLLCLLLCAATHAKQRYTIGVENVDYQPFYTTEAGVFSGFAKDILSLFAQHSEFEFEFVPLPIKRLHDAYLNGELDLLYPDNPDWIPDLKDKKAIHYSDPLVKVVDGVMVKPERKYQGIEKLKQLGTMSGYTLPAYSDQIETGQIELVEVKEMLSLLQMVSFGRIDAAYVTINPAMFALKHQADWPGSLTFDPSLPYDLAEHRMSTFKYNDLLLKFNSFLREHAEQIEALKKHYGIMDIGG
ncbi:MAG: transporter substrate-binding domain-containing protein [Pseudomonadales bacterium]|nr:transporter substrate-binding domain-containing protein [Pseudomonadales bacterium]